MLTTINWVFEILKWRLVVTTFSKISFLKAAYQTLVSYAYGMVTPFNSGNYGKKILFYPKKYRKRIVFLNVSKGLYQLASTAVFGLWSLYVLMHRINLSFLKQSYFLIATMLVGGVVLVVYRKKIVMLFNSLSFKTHALLLLYSVVKYLSFSTVLFLLLKQVDMSFLQLYAGICCVYLLSSILPILNLFDFAIKGSVALWVLVPMGYTDKNILIAYFILWICNHAIPAIVGSFLQYYRPKIQNKC